MDDGPWYQNGLRFSCTRCGDCCTGEPGFVWVTDAEVEALAQRLDQSVEEVRGLYTRSTPRGRTLREQLDGSCIFFKQDVGCTVYDARPRQCRTWPFWESNVASPESWAKTCKVCPGSGRGELIPAEEIALRLKVIRL